MVALGIQGQKSVGNCLAGFYEMNIEKPNGPSWVLGTIFMKKFIVAFDFEKYRIGLA